MDKVKDNVAYMDEAFFNILGEASALEAAKKMRDNQLGSLIVVGGGENLGTVTETDLSRKIVAEGLNPKETKVKLLCVGNTSVGRRFTGDRVGIADSGAF